tara:strand:- start:95 stop:310 length:216 start_codon:yes stop_codon:yes gene_type:complete
MQTYERFEEFMAGTPFMELPERIKYYLLDYKDEFNTQIKEQYDKISLRDFTKKELKELWKDAIGSDNTIFI